MWWRSLYLKTLRQSRAAVLGWGLGMGLLVLAIEASVSSVVSAPGGATMLASVTASFRWAADPVAVTTVGGYTTWKLAFTVLMLAIWPLLAASRLLRGAEERGIMDVLLSLPRGRLRVALEGLAALWTSLLAMAFVIAVVTWAGGQAAHAAFNLADALLFGLNLALATGVFGSIALFVSQFTQRAGTAAGTAGGLLFVFIVLDMLHRTVPGTLWLSALSPVYYFNLSKPLVPSYGADPWGMVLLLALSLVLSTAAIALFVRRDIARSVTLPAVPWGRKAPPTAPRPLAGASWSLRSLYARSLAAIAAPALWWALGLAGFAAFAVLATSSVASQLHTLMQSPNVIALTIAKLGGGGAVNAAVLSALFFFLPLLMMIFAVTQASRWAADEEEGRQELVLATPTPRHRILLARFAAVASAAVAIALATLVAAAVSAAAAGLPLASGRLAAAALSTVPQGLLMAAIGYLLAGWFATALESGLLSFLLAFWFFLSFVGPELSWPPALLRLSPFYYYGTPLVHGVPLADTLGVLAVALAALAAAALRFVRKDIGRFVR